MAEYNSAYTGTEIDNAIGKVKDAELDIGTSFSDQTATFTEALSRDNIAAGEKLSVILGKLAKWFDDLKDVAFSGKYGDLSDKPTIPSAVAVKGDKEGAYRTGNVNLTPANIGALSSGGGTVAGRVRVTTDNLDLGINGNASGGSRGFWEYNWNAYILRITNSNALILGDTNAGGTEIQGDKLLLPAIGSATGTSSNTYINPSSFRVGLVSGSSKRYKHDIKLIEDEPLDPKKLYDLPVVQFVYNDGYLMDEDERNGMVLPGFIVEDMEKLYPVAVDHDQEGRPTNWTDRFLIPAMLALIQEQHKEIEELKKQMERMTD